MGTIIAIALPVLAVAVLVWLMRREGHVLKNPIGMEDVLPIASSLEDEARVLQELAHDVRRLGRPRPFTPKLIWIVTEPVTGLIIETEELNLTMKNTEQVTVTVAPKNRKGGKAQVQNGVFSISDSDGNATDVATLEVNPDNANQATVKGNPETDGVVKVSFTGDSDLGDGINNITAEGVINVTPADANIIDMTISDPTEQA